MQPSCTTLIMMRTLFKVWLIVFCAAASANAALLVGTYGFAADDSATPDGTYGSYATLGNFAGVLSGVTYTRNTTVSDGAGGTTGYALTTEYIHNGSDYVGFTIAPVNTTGFTLESIAVQLRRDISSGGQRLNTLSWGVYNAGSLVGGSSGTLDLDAASINSTWSSAQTLSFGSVALANNTTYEVRFSTAGGNNNGDLRLTSS